MLPYGPDPRPNGYYTALCSHVNAASELLAAMAAVISRRYAGGLHCPRSRVYDVRRAMAGLHTATAQPIFGSQCDVALLFL